MMEKRNRIIEKQAAGDSRDLDDIVDMGAKRFAKPNQPKRGKPANLPDPEPLMPEGSR